MKPITRREFTRTLAAVSTTAALSSFRVLGANDRVRLGFIGLGNRGDQVLDAFLKQSDAEVVAICDIYQPYLNFAAKKIGTSPKRFKDYRKLLELKDVDARGHRHARPLARPANHPRLRGGEGCLCREAHLVCAWRKGARWWRR